MEEPLLYNLSVNRIVDSDLGLGVLPDIRRVLHLLQNNIKNEEQVVLPLVVVLGFEGAQESFKGLVVGFAEILQEIWNDEHVAELNLPDLVLERFVVAEEHGVHVPLPYLGEDPGAPLLFELHKQVGPDLVWALDEVVKEQNGVNPVVVAIKAVFEVLVNLWDLVQVVHQVVYYVVLGTPLVYLGHAPEHLDEHVLFVIEDKLFFYILVVPGEVLVGLEFDLGLLAVLSYFELDAALLIL